MSVLSEDPSRNTVRWSQRYKSINCKGKIPIIEPERGREAPYLMGAMVYYNHIDFDLNFMIDDYANESLETHLAEAICHRCSVSGCSVMKAYGSDPNCDYFTAILPMTPDNFPQQLLIICERNGQSNHSI